jgi:hypothetical protein
MAEMRAHEPAGGYSDVGVSIHVLAADDGHEYLRFDVFDGDPHYHYIRPSGDHNQVIGYDAAANGDMLPWAIGCLTTRLADMLREAGGGEVAARLNPGGLDAAIDQVATMADAARRAQRHRTAAAG